MAEKTHAHERSWPAVLGWGSLVLFSIAFVWIVSSQLGENWAKREDEAIRLTKLFRPPNADHSLEDLTKVYQLNAKQKDAYVGEFQWRAVQKEGPDYEVSLLWREGERHRVALWRVNLKTKDIRPQGEDATGLPARAQQGSVSG